MSSALEGQCEMMINTYEILIKLVRKSVCQDHQSSMLLFAPIPHLPHSESDIGKMKVSDIIKTNILVKFGVQFEKKI